MLTELVFSNEGVALDTYSEERPELKDEDLDLQVRLRHLIRR